MKHLLSSLALIPIMLWGCSCANPGQYAPGKSSKVYICTGPKSKRYHYDSTCKGLSSCSGEVREVSLSEAQKMRRTPCRICAR